MGGVQKCEGIVDELIEKDKGMFHINLVVCAHDIVVTEKGDEYGKTLPSIVEILEEAKLSRASNSDYSLNVAKNVVVTKSEKFPKIPACVFRGGQSLKPDGFTTNTNLRASSTSRRRTFKDAPHTRTFATTSRAFPTLSSTSRTPWTPTFRSSCLERRRS